MRFELGLLAGFSIRAEDAGLNGKNVWQRIVQQRKLFLGRFQDHRIIEQSQPKNTLGVHIQRKEVGGYPHAVALHFSDGFVYQGFGRWLLGNRRQVRGAAIGLGRLYPLLTRLNRRWLLSLIRPVITLPGLPHQKQNTAKPDDEEGSNVLYGHEDIRLVSAATVSAPG